jgi:hypothetical protein
MLRRYQAPTVQGRTPEPNMPAADAERPQFFDLPPVIRQQIYSYLLSTKKTFRYDAAIPYYDFHPAILNVSRRFRQDAGDYMRMFCKFVLLEYTMAKFWDYEDFFKALPVLRGLSKTFVPSPMVTILTRGHRTELNNSTCVYTGPEALYYVVQSYWKMSLAAKSKGEEITLLDPPLDLDELRRHPVIITVHDPKLTREQQYEFLGPYMRVHQKSKHELHGHVDPVFYGLFEQEFLPGNGFMNDDHYIKRFFADFSRDARSYYRAGRFFEAYQAWDTLDGYWLYLNRLSKDDRKFRSVVRYMTAIFASYRLEMYLGCAMAAIHFGDWNLARDAASRPYTRVPKMRISDQYKNLIKLCRWFSLLCEDKVPSIEHSTEYLMATPRGGDSGSKDVESLMLDLLTAENTKGKQVGDYEEFAPWKSLRFKKHGTVRINALANTR